MARLITFKEFQKLSPREQGYAAYMQAEQPGSELKHHQNNPYVGVNDAFEKAWNEGQMAACLDAQDSEE
jgi:hypothetical protein